ncbi:MAG: hypothetical protein JETT_3835 [Candidatus Jettenia ecosi]|uniref:Uncharacterized protein n=1 Tax=Candidatus Jettenia ecosi TaxID=2494326 RepID=A0A533Q5T4_9BACT|nr:MAG: hypothetical protein JETT_3835 [Candidatus Jettenia ecosi]
MHAAPATPEDIAVSFPLPESAILPSPRVHGVGIFDLY